LYAQKVWGFRQLSLVGSDQQLGIRLDTHLDELGATIRRFQGRGRRTWRTRQIHAPSNRSEVFTDARLNIIRRLADRSQSLESPSKGTKEQLPWLVMWYAFIDVKRAVAVLLWMLRIS
jgi:hypothetical protein